MFISVSYANSRLSLAAKRLLCSWGDISWLHTQLLCLLHQLCQRRNVVFWQRSLDTDRLVLSCLRTSPSAISSSRFPRRWLWSTCMRVGSVKAPHRPVGANKSPDGIYFVSMKGLLDWQFIFARSQKHVHIVYTLVDNIIPASTYKHSILTVSSTAHNDSDWSRQWCKKGLSPCCYSPDSMFVCSGCLQLPFQRIMGKWKISLVNINKQLEAAAVPYSKNLRLSLSWCPKVKCWRGYPFMLSQVKNQLNMPARLGHVIWTCWKIQICFMCIESQQQQLKEYFSIGALLRSWRGLSRQALQVVFIWIAIAWQE